MDETLIPSSVRKRLNIQNEVLKWLEDFSEKMEKRANAATMELHELLDQTRVVELDLKNTFSAFRNLSHVQFVENKVSEGDEMKVGDVIKDFVHVGVPAQSYEVDILPRYKEALSLGLSSYKNHLQKSNRSTSSGALFKFGLACGPLPHIIGSEEYLHDNSCGLTTEDFIMENAPLDFRHVTEPDLLHSNSGGSCAMLSADLFGIEKDPSEKEGPLVSAASDFKAMLEAALRSPYKFYDDESSSLADAVGCQNKSFQDVHAKMDHISSKTSSTVAKAKLQDSQHATSIENSSMPIFAGNLAFLQQTDNNAHKLCSTLLSEGLFDSEEDSLASNQMQFSHFPASTADSDGFEGTEVTGDANIPADFSGLSNQECHVIDSRNNKEEVHEEPQPRDGDDSECFSSTCSHFSVHNKETPKASADGESRTENSMKHSSQYDSLICNTFEEDSVSGISSETSGDTFKDEENKISSGQILHLSLSVTPKAVNDFENNGDSSLTDHLSKPASSPSSSTPEGSSMVCCVPRESITQFKMVKPIVNDKPLREDTMFSTVISVSPELDGLFSSVTLSRTCDLDTQSRSNGLNNKSGATVEENTKAGESCNTMAVPLPPELSQTLEAPELSQTPEAIQTPSVVKVGDDLEAGGSNCDSSDSQQNTDEEQSMNI